jgi:hypothetical protein
MWEGLSRANRRIPIHVFGVTMHPNSAVPRHGVIVMRLAPLKLVTASLDPWTGAERFAIHRHWQFDNPPTEGRDPLDLALSCLWLTLVTQGIYPMRVDSLPVFNPDIPQRFARSFSFAPDFALQIGSRGNRPTIAIIDANGESRTNPAIVQMESLAIAASWQLFNPVLVSCKRLLFLFQTKSCLSELKIDSVIIGDMLSIHFIGCRHCSLTIDENGWRLLFVSINMLHVGRKEMFIKIYGLHYSARVTRLIASLVSAIHTWRRVVCQIMLCSHESKVVTSCFSDETHLFLRIKDTETLTIALQGAFERLGTVQNTVYLVCPYNFRPFLSIRFARTIPLRQYFDALVGNADTACRDIMAFIHGFVVPLLRFSDLFGGIKSDWTFSNLNPMHRCCAVYRRRYSIGIMLNPMMVCGVSISHVPPNHLLVIPIMSICDRPKSGRDHSIIKIKMALLPQLKTVIEQFCDRLMLLDETGFKLFEVIKERYMMRHKQTFNGVPVVLDLIETRVEIHCKAGADIDADIKRLLGEALSDVACLRAVITVFRAFLQTDQALLRIVLQLLGGIALGVAEVCHALSSARVNENGDAAMEVEIKGRIVGFSFPAAVSPGAVILISRGSGTERARDVEGALELIRRM